VKKKDRQTMCTMQASLDLGMLTKPVHLDLSLNDLRIIVGCFRAVAYQAKVDDEPYLDPDAVALKTRLELQYRKLLDVPDPGGDR
jgi:hypothetical protein